MDKTPFDKEKISDNLDTLKAMIDERQALVESARAEKISFNEAIDKTIRENEDELKHLRVKAAEILGIPSSLSIPEGKVPTQKERGGDEVKEISPSPVETPVEEGVQ